MLLAYLRTGHITWLIFVFIGRLCLQCYERSVEEQVRGSNDTDPDAKWIFICLAKQNCFGRGLHRSRRGVIGRCYGLLPIYASDILAVGPGLGLMRAMPGIGALFMGLVLAQIAHPRYVGATMLLL